MATTENLIQQPMSAASELSRQKRILRVLLIEGSANLAVLCLKIIVGFSTGSLAILGDAVHSLTDLSNNFVAWWLVVQSGKPPDRQHPYGHRKFETLAVFGLATVLMVVAFEIVLQVFRRQERDIVSSPLELTVMLAVLVTNIVVTTWERRQAKLLHSDILAADASHTFADVMVTLVVIIGWQLSVFTLPWIDTVCAFFVAIFVAYLAFELFRKVIPVLVDEAAIEPEKLAAMVAGIVGVEHVLRVRSRWIGDKKSADVVLTVRPELTVTESHAIADRVENMLATESGIQDVSIHIEPHLAPPE